MNEQHNAYTITGLKVPYLDERLAELQAEITSLRTLLTAATDAITRVDADVGVIIEVLQLDRAESPART